MAALKAMLLVQILPSLGISFASTAIVGLMMVPRLFGSGGPANSMLVTVPVIMAGLSAVLTVAKDVAFVVWARQKLYASFRQEAARAIQNRGAPGTPLRLVGTPAPPVISGLP